MKYQINSYLDYKNVVAEFKSITTFIKSNHNNTISLVNVKHIDSSGIAMLVELKNMINKLNKQISFVDITPEIINLCSLYNVSLID